ncbi:MAG: hypothetical protein KBD27_01915 [Candidatus Moranbacteria bacterium]|nr:hypothetical protein [Candidatus Moranbacteria bacterium]
MNLADLEKALQKSWSKETSYSPESWTVDNPAVGQCAITALVVNDYHGGEIVWADVALSDGQAISHYFNLINGKEIDLSRSQFPEGTVIPKGTMKNKNFPTTRDFMLSNDNTKKRYEILKVTVIAAKQLVNEKKELRN